MNTVSALPGSEPSPRSHRNCSERGLAVLMCIWCCCQVECRWCLPVFTPQMVWIPESGWDELTFPCAATLRKVFQEWAPGLALLKVSLKRRVESPMTPAHRWMLGFSVASQPQWVGSLFSEATTALWKLNIELSLFCLHLQLQLATWTFMSFGLRQVT